MSIAFLLWLVNDDRIGVWIMDRIKKYLSLNQIIHAYLLPLTGFIILIDYFFLFRDHFHVLQYDSLDVYARAKLNIEEYGAMRLSGNITRINDPLTRNLLIIGIVVGLVVFIHSCFIKRPAFIALLFIFGCALPFLSSMSDSAGGGANVISRVLIGILMLITATGCYFYFITISGDTSGVK